MIRLAFIGVFLIAGLLAFGGFSLMRSVGGDPDQPQDTPDARSPASGEQIVATPETPPVEPYYFLRDLDLSGDGIALVLFNVGADRDTVVIRDKAALEAAQDGATIAPNVPKTRFAHRTQTTPAAGAFLQVYRNDTLVEFIDCPDTTCATLADTMDVDYAGLLAAGTIAQPLEDTFDTYDSYLDALAFVRSSPDYAFLGIGSADGQTHPVTQQTPSVEIVLPTIYRFADAPLDIETHTAILSALVETVLPEGATLHDMTITQHDPAIVVELETGSPATRAGQHIPFNDIVFYTPRFKIEGISALSDETLETLTEDTMLRVDWEQAGEDFVTTLGVPCAECFAVQSTSDVFNRANVTAANPELYTLRYYDLREAP